MHPFRRFPTLVLAVACAAQAATAIASEPAGQPTIGLDEIHRGMRGEGVSVFAGTDTETFEVEVLGILEHSTPELGYVIARLTGRDLERSGVVAGMSGSPVYLDGRLAGAVAFSYLFGLDAIAGITPIDAMRRLIPPPGSSPGVAADPARPAGSGLAVPEIEDLVSREGSADLLREHLARWAGPPLEGASAALTWSAGGFGERTLALLGEGLGARVGLATVGAGSGRTGALPAELAGGSPVAMVVVDGDLSLAAHGTVTERAGDEVLAFGHPIFGSGPARFPMATAEVVTIVASRFSSFKVSNVGEIVGSFEEDRQAGTWGRLGIEAPMIPVSITLEAERSRDYRVRVADVPELSPALIAISMLGALDAGARAGGPQSLELEARFDLGPRGSLELRQGFDGATAAFEAAGYLLSYAAWLEGNPLETPPVVGVEMRVRQLPEPRIATLVGARAARRTVAPGESLAVAVDVRDWRGEIRTEAFTVEVPRTAAEGAYYLLLGDGPQMDGTRLALERRRATTFDEGLEMLSGLHSSSQLVALGLQVRPGLSLRGATLPDLPGSVRRLLAGAQPAPSPRPLAFGVLAEDSFDFDRPLAGSVRLDLRVRRPLVDAASRGADVP